ncbi:MAG: hypothetical protein IH892_09450 [Planctomycetes bacterium]|nr:hypothetical protein [Planctomycetota bacterium]
MLANVVERLKSGDKTACRRWVEATQAEVRTSIACNGIGLPDVDDIAQLTYLHIDQHVDAFESGIHSRAWIHTLPAYKTKAFPINVDIALGGEERFLTLATMDSGDVKGHDGCVFSEPFLELADKK